MKDRFAFPEDPNDDFGFLFWQVTKGWQRYKFKLLEEFDLTPSQLEVLSAICHLLESQEEVSQVEISQLTNVDPMTVSSVLRNLEKKDFVIRSYSSVDTRARTVSLTEKGSELLFSALTKMKKESESLLGDVDQEVLKKEFRILLDIITKINN